MSCKQAYVTMVTSDSYVMGALVLGHSISKTQDKSNQRPICCMVTEDVSSDNRQTLEQAGLQTVLVDSISCDELIGCSVRESSGIGPWDQSGYTKLNIWKLTEFQKLVYVDADCLVMDNMDDLFDRETKFAAAPDTFPPDRFNAGVLVIEPSQEVFDDMMSKIGLIQSYDGGDTGFLNSYFNDWFARDKASRLPFRYNALRTMYWLTQKKPGYWSAVGRIKCLHFCSFPKPWDQVPKGELEQKWWVAFAECQLMLRMKGVRISALKKQG